MAICGLLQTTKLKRIIFLSLLMGDFNLTIENKHLEISLITSPLYFQFTNPTCIDLTLTNQEDLFSNFETCEVGITDHHHHLASTILNKKKKKSKGNDKTLFYRD